MNTSDLTLAACPQAALDLASFGWEVFPLAFGPNGHKKSHASAQYSGGRRWGATTDPAELRRMFRRWSTAGVGIATGPASGIFVLDVDTDEEHAADGFESLAKLEAKHSPLPVTVTAESPSGGRHFYFRWPADGEPICTVAGRVAPGIGQRGAGGMVAAPPTLRPGRIKGYRWIFPPGRVAVADAPDWVLTLCRKPKPSQRASATKPQPWNGPSHQPADLAEVVAMLDFIDPDAGGYDAWCNVLMALHDHSGGSTSGLALAESWSARGAMYRAGEVATKWKSFAAGNGVTVATIAELARQNGADLTEIALTHLPRTGLGLGGRRTNLGARRRASLQASGEDDTPADYADELVTEDNAALKFAVVYVGHLRYCWDTGAWFTWTGHHWQQDRTGRAFQWARELARTLSRTEADRVRFVSSKTSFAAGVERFARSDPAFAVTNDAWDQDAFLLGTPEGTVDLRTGVLRASDPSEGITKATAVAPSETAHCPRWRRFLEEATAGNAELIRFLQQWCGYNLTGDTREQALLFGYGAGGNGKSVLLNTIVSILSDYAVTAAMDTFVASSGDRHPTDLAMLRGARMVTASETEEGRAWAEVRIKALTGGDPITARYMRQDPFTYTPQFKLTIVGNHRPALRNVDEAMRRRFNMVSFAHRPQNPDPELEAKLKEEWPGILRWMVEGCLDWQKHGLVRPECVKAATSAYFSEEDTVGQWLEDECDVRPGNHSWFELGSAVFGAWTAYAAKAGEPAGTKKAFADNMKRRGIEPDRSSVGRGFRGIRLKPRVTEHDA